MNLSLDAKEMEVKKIDGGRERKTSSWLNWFSSVNTAEAQVGPPPSYFSFFKNIPSPTLPLLLRTRFTLMFNIFSSDYI